jgi:hypothetical protein
MSEAPSEWDDVPLRPEPVRAISRVAAPGGVPLGVTIFALVIPLMLSTLALAFLSILPFPIALLPVGWWRLQKWYGDDLKKLQISVGYLAGAWLTSDPKVTRPDGSQRPLWGGSTFSPLPAGPIGGMPRFLPLPKD